MTQICFLSSVHPALDVRIFHKEASSLKKAGYHVTIIAQHDHDEIIDGIRIVAISQHGDRIRRMTKTFWQIYKKLLTVKADIYHFHDPELILLGLFLKASGCKVVYDVHEDVPRDILIKEWIPYLFRRPVSLIVGMIERVSALAFDAVVAATPKIAENFQVERTVVVQNYPIEHEITVLDAPPYRERPYSFIYTGGIELIRGAMEMIGAIEALHDILAVRLDMAGTFYPVGFEEELRAHPGWALVHYHGQVSWNHVKRLLGFARAGLVLLHPTITYKDSYPVKMFEYMSAGLPVIASDFPLWRQIIEDAHCGLLVNPRDPKAIADAMMWILDNPAEAEVMGKNGCSAVKSKYNWETEGAKLLDLYGCLLGEKCAG